MCSLEKKEKLVFIFQRIDENPTRRYFSEGVLFYKNFCLRSRFERRGREVGANGEAAKRRAKNAKHCSIASHKIMARQSSKALHSGQKSRKAKHMQRVNQCVNVSSHPPTAGYTAKLSSLLSRREYVIDPVLHFVSSDARRTI